MKNDEPNRNFLLGNVLLGSALLMLLFIGSLWDFMGPAAMGLWIALAGMGAYLLMHE